MYGNGITIGGNGLPHHHVCWAMEINSRVGISEGSSPPGILEGLPPPFGVQAVRWGSTALGTVSGTLTGPLQVTSERADNLE